MPPRIAIVRQMAGLLAAQRTGPTTIQPIGEKWAYNFVKRHTTHRPNLTENMTISVLNAKILY